MAVHNYRSPTWRVGLCHPTRRVRLRGSSMPPEPFFQPFDPDGELRVYMRNLPHWRQPGVTYFVTFRQDDSIPAVVLEEWLDSRERFYRAHGLDPGLQDVDPKGFEVAYHRIPEGVRQAYEREQSRMLHEELDYCHGSC